MIAVVLAVLAVITGTLHGSRDNRPIANARIEVRSTSGTIATTTARNGRFALVGVPAGQATLTLDAPGYSPVSIKMCIHADEDRRLALKLTTGGSIPQLKAVSDYDNAAANGIPQSTTNAYYLGC
jgi:hypothetical protein